MLTTVMVIASIVMGVVILIQAAALVRMHQENADLKMTLSDINVNVRVVADGLTESTSETNKHLGYKLHSMMSDLE